MKITKSQLHKVIQEELQAELNEEIQLPANVTRLLGMIMNDAGDDKVAAKLQQLNQQMSINFKVLLAQTILDEFGIPYDVPALKTAMTKGIQQQKTDPRANIIKKLRQQDDSPSTSQVTVPAGGPPPQQGSGAGAGR